MTCQESGVNIVSRRTSEANKAIAAKWAVEQQLVREGKGTRDWTPEQQKDILEKGKAYDENGLAFEGQHMKSVAAFPEYQGDPNNIQFLTKQEHLEAHDGSRQNSTNWFFNPETKQKIQFGDGQPIPCEIINLSNPSFSSLSVPTEDDNSEQLDQQERSDNEPLDPTTTNNNSENPKGKQPHIQTTSPPEKTVWENLSEKVSHISSKVMSFGKSQPIATAVIGTAFGFAVELGKDMINGAAKESVTSSESSYASSGPHDKTNNPADGDDSVLDDVSSFSEEQDCPNERSSPREHDVKEHIQRYHTKDGVIEKEKKPYHRGGNKE